MDTVRETDAVPPQHAPPESLDRDASMSDGNTTEHRRPFTHRDKIIIAITLVILAAPVAAGLYKEGTDHAVVYLAGDISYYLGVAQNVILHGRFSFDQEHATNGFHPLWQLWAVVLEGVAIPLGLSKSQSFLLLLLSSMAFVGTALVVLGRCFTSAHGRVPLLFMLLPMGVHGLLAFLNAPYCHGSLWSLANGMESPLVILSYALVLYAMLQPGFLSTMSSALLFGGLLTLLSLSRLDHAIFVPVAFVCLALYFLLKHDYRRFLLLIPSGTVVLVVMLAYLAINWFYAGSALPMSGTMKSTFPHITVSNWDALHTVFKEPFSDRAISIQWRVMQMFVPPLFAAAALIRAVWRATQRRLTPMDFALATTGLFVILLAAYNILFVFVWNQGSWYFPVSILFVSLFVLHLACEWRGRRRIPRMVRAVAWIAMLLVLVVSGDRFRVHGNEAYWLRLLFGEIPSVTEHYAGQSVKFISYDDGMFCFGSELPAVGGFLLVGDKALLDHCVKRDRSLWTLAYQRGFDHIVISEQRSVVERLNYGMSSAEIAQIIKEPPSGLTPDLLRAGEPPFFSLSVDYLSPNRWIAVLKMVPDGDRYLQDLP